MHRKILIIDDEEAIRDVAKVTLAALRGWAVLTACSGSEGIAVAAAERPDAILLDVMMPGMDGFQTLKALQQNTATGNIPVLLFTAQVNLGDRKDSMADGARAIIFKPFNPLRLAGQVAQALGW